MIKSLLAIFLVSLLSLCNTGKGKSRRPEAVQSYEAPPTPPIPPETYCYELRNGEKNADFTSLELTIVGDSAYGTLDYKPGEKAQANGKLVGVVYGNSLLMSYKYMTEGISKTEDQEWKMAGDSILKKIASPLPGDSLHAAIDLSDKNIFSPALYKVRCK